MSEEKISVQLTQETLFDFLLYHTYSRFGGFLTNVLGMAVGIMGVILMAVGKITWVHLCIYLVAGAASIAYTPLLLKSRAKKQMQENARYRERCEYIFSEEGITVCQNGTEQTYGWKDMQRAVVTPKNIGIYYGKDQALILPKENLEGRFIPIMQTLTAHLGRQNVRLR